MEIERQTPFQKQIEELLAKEKVARMGNDMVQSSVILRQIVQLCYDMKEFQALFDNVETLAKKRGQSKKAQIDMVQLCMELMGRVTDITLKMQFVESIKRVCDKKIYLEVEYARCCLMLVKHKESAQNIDEAAKILQEVQVETYGSMDKREKLEFILYQMNIMIKKKDYVRLLVISRKIKPANLEDATILDLKITYYSYLVEYHNHEGNYYECAQAYQKIWETLYNKPELRQQLPETIDFGFNIEYRHVLQNYVLYLAISPFNQEKQNQLITLNTTHKPELEKEKNLERIVQLLLSQELISTNIETYDISGIHLFKSHVENHEKHYTQLKKILIQHNILIIQKYYKQIQLKRLAGLLQIDENFAENELCQMINEKKVYCKIDRIEGTINFQPKQTENDVLNRWNSDIDKILRLIDQTSNLIKREEEKYL